MANPKLWYQDAVLYEVYVRAFADGNGDGHGDFVGLTQKLDYFAELDIDCLWIQPMYPSPLKDDGYDIADYYNIHPDYGTLDDFKTFLNEAHKRGLRVITDLVLNHCSDQHPWFQSARQSKDSPYRDYFVWSDSDQKYKETRIIFLDTEKSNWTWDEQAGQYYWHRFYSSQPDLNYDNPALRAEMLNVLKFWMDLGMDGFRADAVPYLFEREGTNCENLPETHAYLKELRRYMDEHYPEAILLAEANQWPQDLRPYFGDEQGAEFHMAFHFPVMPRLYMALARSDRTAILDILAATPEIPEDGQWCNFLRNHDELTLEMVTLEERDWMWQTFAPDPRMKLNLGIRRRLAPLLDGDTRKIKLLLSILLTLPGAPILYYGDEIGMGDNIQLDDRHGVRTPMQWDASANGGFSTAAKTYSPVIADATFGYQRVNVAQQRADPNSLWYTTQKLLATRKQHPALRARANQLTFDTTYPTSVLAYTRGDSAKPAFLVLHNLSGAAQTVPLRYAASARDVLSDRGLAGQIELQAYETMWLKLG